MAEQHSETLPLCTFGLLCREECHKMLHTRHVGFHNRSDLSDGDFELLCLRTEHGDHIHKAADFNICFHHEQVLLHRFNQLQRNCCDPFNKHPSKVTKSLRAVTIEKA